ARAARRRLRQARPDMDCRHATHASASASTIPAEITPQPPSWPVTLSTSTEGGSTESPPASVDSQPGGKAAYGSGTGSSSCPNTDPAHTGEPPPNRTTSARKPVASGSATTAPASCSPTTATALRSVQRYVKPGLAAVRSHQGPVQPPPTRLNHQVSS